MMEKSVQGEFSAAGRSFPPYSAGNNHNTWYAATMVDARGVEIPYVDRDGKELKTVSERYYPAKGQKFFLRAVLSTIQSTSIGGRRRWTLKN